MSTFKMPEPKRLYTLTNRDGDPHHIMGYTADQLRAHVATYAALSTASDDDLRAHLAQSRERMSERLAVLRAS